MEGCGWNRKLEPGASGRICPSGKYQLDEDHWDVIHFMRDYYDEHQVIPDARFAIKHLSARLGAAARNRLFELFPYGYVKQACKIAGMKRPRGWSTG